MNPKGVVLKNSPILVVLAQVRISPILQMENFVAEMQECFRREGFPDFNRIAQGFFGASPGIPNLAQNPLAYWEFSNQEQTESVIVGTESIAFTATKYSTFNDFRSRVSAALSVIHEIVQVPLCKRVGIRFLNLIVPGPGKSLWDYLRPELLGLPVEDLSIERLGFGSQMVCRSGQGTFVLRSASSPKGNVLPPDFGIFNLKTTKPLAIDQEFCTLDLDHFVEGSSGFDAGEILTKLTALHDVIETAFLSAVTPESLKEWN